jgi:hypothetical protein
MKLAKTVLILLLTLVGGFFAIGWLADSPRWIMSAERLPGQPVLSPSVILWMKDRMKDRHPPCDEKSLPPVHSNGGAMFIPLACSRD